MRILGLAFFCALFFSSSVQRTSAQERQKPCLDPDPEAAFTRHQDLQKHGSPPSRGSTTLYVSSLGKLCRTFSFQSTIQGDFETEEGQASKPGRAFLLSAAIPGAGQWYLGQRRWPAYLAVELWAWLQFLDWRREGHKLQSQYKDLAWHVARRVSTGPRTDAGWDYYEALGRFQASGAYDSDPLEEGVQPENDPQTFNGSMWVLAQEIYIPEDPEIPADEGSDAYQKAFDYYLSRAYAPQLAWDWGANTLHQEEYSALIRESDEALRSSTGMIGVILANHLLSAVDALVSGRLGIAGATDPAVEFSLRPGPFHSQEVVLSVRLPDPRAYVH